MHNCHPVPLLVVKMATQALVVVVVDETGGEMVGKMAWWWLHLSLLQLLAWW